MIRSRTAALAAAFLLLGLAPRPARAWDDLGHMVTVRIAWSRLPAATRARIVALLAQAPADAGLADLRPAADADADLMFAAYASTWADLARRPEPAARHAYHRASWHYINWFWTETASGAVEESSTLHPDSVNIVSELRRQSAIVADTTRPAGERAIALAWVLHLAGDITQPLHTSSRVTPDHLDGDRGGNLFLLDRPMSLHWYWDRTLSERHPRESGEGDDAYVARVAALVAPRAPADTMGADVERWARGAFALAEHDVYCCGIVEGSAAPPEYLTHADAIAEPAIALAGVRLAALLERLLGT